MLAKAVNRGTPVLLKVALSLTVSSAVQVDIVILVPQVKLIVLLDIIALILARHRLAHARSVLRAHIVFMLAQVHQLLALPTTTALRVLLIILLPPVLLACTPISLVCILHRSAITALLATTALVISRRSHAPLDATIHSKESATCMTVSLVRWALPVQVQE